MSNVIMKALPAVLLGGAAGALLVYFTSDNDRGLSGPWGDHPSKTMALPADFAKHYAVVYLKFQQTASGLPELVVKHAYFNKISGQADDIDCAIKLLAGETSPGNCKADGNIRENFEGFNFGKRMHIYAHIANSNVQFNHKTPMLLTPYGSHDPIPHTGLSGREKDKNKSFYNARLENISQNDQRKILKVDNFLRDKNGQDINNPTNNNKLADYSINFNIVMCKKGTASCNLEDPKAVIPMVIDPDGGNMGGGNPPPG